MISEISHQIGLSKNQGSQDQINTSRLGRVYSWMTGSEPVRDGDSSVWHDMRPAGDYFPTAVYHLRQTQVLPRGIILQRVPDAAAPRLLFHLDYHCASRCRATLRSRNSDLVHAGVEAAEWNPAQDPKRAIGLGRRQAQARRTHRFAVA
jgi:hypothetical protein